MIIWDTVCIRFFKWQIDFSKGVIFRIDCVAFLMCCMRPFDSVKKFLKSLQSSGLVQHVGTATREKGVAVSLSLLDRLICCAISV